MRERFNRDDYRFLAACVLLAAVSLFLVLRYFSAAFPEASIDFRYDRGSSLAIAERVLRQQSLPDSGMKHSAVFDTDDHAKIFLERSLGLRVANGIMKRDVHVWWWHHRWFRPLQEEEWSVDIAPAGELVSFRHQIPEARPLPAATADDARRIAESFLSAHASLADLQFVSVSERRLPGRLQRIFTWDSRAVHPVAAPYRTTVSVDGNIVTDYAQRLHVPEQWERQYRELRSKNLAAGNADTIFLALTMIAALVIFVVRLRRGDVAVRMLMTIAAITVVLVTLNSLNSFPSALASYDTTSSYPAFIAQQIIGSILQSLAVAMLLVVIVGSGEVLYRQRLPKQLAIPRLWQRNALQSRRVFRSFVLGYTLVAFFLAYQVVFYLIAAHFGAWAPAEVPYDDILNSAFPWVAVLFAGWFPALSEEFMSRAFSIPFVERILRSRIAAIIISGFIWGFGHATYPNQPFYIRGVEVGLAGVALGFFFQRFGLLPLLIWHYTIDALYTALLLFRSNNAYYIGTAAAAALIFSFPMIASLVLYFRNGGFAPEEELLNEALPVREMPPSQQREETTAIEFPPALPLRNTSTGVTVAAIAIAIALSMAAPPSLQDAVDYRTTAAQAKSAARSHLTGVVHQKPEARMVALPIDGFRRWDPSSPREEGGGPGGQDDDALHYLRRHGFSPSQLVTLLRQKMRAATWSVRSFTPVQKRELFVEVDPQTNRVVGYHKYQDERAPGPRLEQPAATAIALAAFPTYGVNAADFDLREALAFQQPARRDWLFHFQERRPIAADAWRRVTVRVAGAEVTQFTTTVKIPDTVYRDEHQETLLIVALSVVKIAGIIFGLALVISGIIISTRSGRLHWRRALRWTLVAAFVPLVSSLSSIEQRLFSYNNSIQWQTFQFDLLIDFLRDAGMELGLFFLAVASLQAAFPYALSLLRREGRARFGKSAAVAATGCVAVFAALRYAQSILAVHWAAFSELESLHAPSDVLLPLPAVLALSHAGFTTILASAAIAMIFVSLQALSRSSFGKLNARHGTTGDLLRPLARFGELSPAEGAAEILEREESSIEASPINAAGRPGLVAAIAISTMFAVSLSFGVGTHAIGATIVHAAATAAVVWLLARYLLGANPLAWPAAIFTLSLVQHAGLLLGNHRSDLTIQAIAELGIAAAALFWLAIPRSARA